MSFPLTTATTKGLLVSAKLLEGHLAGVNKQLGELIEGLTLMLAHDRISNEEDDRERDKNEVSFDDLEEIPF